MSFVPLDYFHVKNRNSGFKTDIHYGCTKSVCKNTIILSDTNMNNTILSVYVFLNSHYFGVKLRKTKIFMDLVCGIEVFSILPPQRVDLSLFTLWSYPR